MRKRVVEKRGEIKRGGKGEEEEEEGREEGKRIFFLEENEVDFQYFFHINS